LVSYKFLKEEGATEGTTITPFKLLANGSLELIGKITSQSGEIGGWIIEKNGLISEH
jgi:hypothetical protein